MSRFNFSLPVLVLGGLLGLAVVSTAQAGLPPIGSPVNAIPAYPIGSVFVPAQRCGSYWEQGHYIYTYADRPMWVDGHYAAIYKGPYKDMFWVQGGYAQQ